MSGHTGSCYRYSTKRKFPGTDNETPSVIDLCLNPNLSEEGPGVS